MEFHPTQSYYADRPARSGRWRLEGGGWPPPGCLQGRSPGTKIEQSGVLNSETESGFRVITAQSQRSSETQSEYGFGVLDLVGVLPRSLSPEHKATRVFGVLDVFGILGELEFGLVSVVNPNSIDLLCLTLSVTGYKQRVL